MTPVAAVKDSDSAERKERHVRDCLREIRQLARSALDSPPPAAVRRYETLTEIDRLAAHALETW